MITASELEKAADDLEAELKNAPPAADYEMALLLTSLAIMIRAVANTYRAAALRIRTLEGVVKGGVN